MSQIDAEHDYYRRMPTLREHEHHEPHIAGAEVILAASAGARLATLHGMVVGRQSELVRLAGFLAGIGDGPSAVVVEGAAGIGKTSVLDAAVAAAPSGLTVLRTRCSQAESVLAYTGLADLLGGCGEDVLAGLFPPQRQALDVLLSRSAPGPGVIAPQVVGRATLAALRALAPVLIVVDDAHWLDRPSARALAFALRRSEDLAVGVLATRRGTGELWLDDAAPPVRLDRLSLGALADDDLALIVERPRLSRRSQAWVVRTAAGNPMYALELVERPDTVPARLESLVADRLNRLPLATGEVLAVVACLPAPTVAQLVDVLGEHAAPALNSALDAEVVLVEEGRIRFSHPLLGAAALTRIPPSARRALHTRLAEVVTDAEQRAQHLVRAADGPDEAVAAAIEDGATLARARGAPETAAELTEAAVRLTPPEQNDNARRRLVAAGYHRVTAGEIHRGREHMAAAVARMAAGPDRAETQWRLAMLTFLDDDLGQAVELLRLALRECDDDVALTATVATKLTGMLWWQGHLAESVRHGRRALELADATNDPRCQLDAAMLYVRSATASAAQDVAPLVKRIEELGPTAGPRAPHEAPEIALAGHELMTGDYSVAVGRLETAYRRAADEGDEIAVSWLGQQLSDVLVITGDWQRAGLLADNALRDARRLGWPGAIHPALWATCQVKAYLGELQTDDPALAELAMAVRDVGLVPAEFAVRSLIGFVALSHGDAAAAHAELGPLLERMSRLGFREPMWFPLAWCELDVLVELGQLTRAAVLADDLHGLGTRLDRPFAMATAARCRGRIAAAGGDFGTALAELDAAMAHHDRFAWPFERARTLLALGAVRRRAKQKRAARDALDDALAVFSRLGARLWAAKASAELARIGGRPPRSSELTATEQRVAALVAQGHTNAEVAGLLFLSAKTVAAHLTHVYAKLGVRSRAELVGQMRDTT
jgi:DNA-binding CsgD family transcriptional regulator